MTGSPRQNLAMEIAESSHELMTLGAEIRKAANLEVVSVDPTSRAVTSGRIFAGLLRVVQLTLTISLKLGRMEGSAR